MYRASAAFQGLMMVEHGPKRVVRFLTDRVSLSSPLDPGTVRIRVPLNTQFHRVRVRVRVTNPNPNLYPKLGYLRPQWTRDFNDHRHTPHVLLCKSFFFQRIQPCVLFNGFDTFVHTGLLNTWFNVDDTKPMNVNGPEEEPP